MLEHAAPARARRRRCPTGEHGSRDVLCRWRHYLPMAKSPRYLVPDARGACARSTLDLLPLPLPFTQTQLLEPSKLVTEAEKRKIRVETGQLEVLQREHLLVPFFEVSLGKADPNRVVEFDTSRTPDLGAGTFVTELYRAAADGRASDPRLRPSRGWSARRVRALWPQRARGYLYSWHQLLAIRWLQPTINAMRYDRTSKTWSLPTAAGPSATDVRVADSWRGLAVTLAAIDARYWPHITHTIRQDAEAWRDFNQSFDPAAILQWTQLGLADVVAAADQLRHLAVGIDVLGSFYDLVRRADSRAWGTLRGDALIAMDYRVASEALDAFADDLGRPPVQAAQSSATLRLTARHRTTDAVLTELGMSPHPSVVVGLEGDTEELLLPRVFDVLGIPHGPDWIRMAEFGGVDKDLTNLAKFAAAPQLGTDRGTSVDLDRPVTRFLVLVDAEKRYSDRKKRARERKKLLDAVAAALPPDLRGDLYGRAARIVEIRTWGTLPFEFAHFTDLQLAAAMEKAAKTPYPSGRAALVADIKAERSRPHPNLENLWRQGRWPGARLRKPTLADACWPTLETKIKRALASGSAGPPIMRAAMHAWELALIPTRNRMALRRH
jgi:hypothetical protein